MSNGWSAQDYVDSTNSRNVIAGIVTDQVVSKEFTIYANGALNFVVAIKASGVAQTGTITAKLQTTLNGTWEDSKSTTFTANGMKYIRLNVQDEDDQVFLPLLNKGRLVLTTTSPDDDITIDSVHILQAL